MTVRELINTMKENENIDLKELLEFREYIPVSEKRAIIDSIIEKDLNISDNLVHYDTVQLNIDFEMAMIKYHTNIDIGDLIEDYDLLHQPTQNCWIAYDVIAGMCRLDVQQCFEILQNKLKDIERDYSINSAVISMITVLSNGIEKTLEKVQGFNIADVLPKDLDKEQLSKLFEKYVK